MSDSRHSLTRDERLRFEQIEEQLDRQAMRRALIVLGVVTVAVLAAFFGVVQLAVWLRDAIHGVR